MLYIFKGRLCGYLCAECPEPLPRVKVRLYRIRPQQSPTAAAVANPKDTIAPLTDEEVKKKGPLLIAEAETDAEGRFAFELSDKQNYNGEPFELDVYIERVPNQKGGKEPQPRQFTITTLQPMWREAPNGLIWAWEYCLPERIWCLIRGLFGAWVICGRVVDCQTKAPIGNVRVFAFDADWISDDPLGNAVTDSAGKFRIDYSTADFHVTFLSPIINVETPFPPFDSGPDVYFRVETIGGSVLLAEGRPDGHKPGRENVGYCLCVELCLEEPPDQHIDTIPLFTKVGAYEIDPFPGDFTAAGLTTAGNYAFTGSIPLIGIMPDGQNSQALEYHFRWAEYNAAGTVLGPVSDVTIGMIGPTDIGELEYWDWNPITMTWTLRSATYWVNNPGVAPTTIHRPPPMGGDLVVTLNKPVKAGGWIEVPTENELFAGGVGRFIPNSGKLIVLNTTTMNNESYDLTLPAPGLQAGDSVPLASKSRPHYFKLFFEARRVIMPNPILSSNALEKIVICNITYTYTRHPNWAGGNVSTRAVVSLNIAELAAPGAGCTDLSNELHALYTAHHPFTGSGSVYLEGPTPPPLPAPIALAFAPDGEDISPVGGALISIAAQPPCAYILWLEVTLRLTSGYGLISGATIWDHIAFCKS